MLIDDIDGLGCTIINREGTILDDNLTRILGISSFTVYANKLAAFNRDRTSIGPNCLRTSDTARCALNRNFCISIVDEEYCSGSSAHRHTRNRVSTQIKRKRLRNRDIRGDFHILHERDGSTFCSSLNSSLEGSVRRFTNLSDDFSHRTFRNCYFRGGIRDRHLNIATRKIVAFICLEGELRVRINSDCAKNSSFAIVPRCASNHRKRYGDLGHSELDGVASNDVAETFRSSGEFSEINLCSICAGDNLSTSTSTFRKCKGHISRERNSARGINALNRAVRISDCHITCASERW